MYIASGDYIVGKILDEEVTSGGIHIPGTVKSLTKRVLVHSVGPKVEDKTITVGCVAIVGPSAAGKLEDDYVVFPKEYVFCVVEVPE